MLTLKWRQIPPLKGDKGDVIKHFTINITVVFMQHNPDNHALKRYLSEEKQ